MYLYKVEQSKKIILFDGVCNLCNNSVQFVIKRDVNDVFQFAALQSETGKKLLTERNKIVALLPEIDTNGMVKKIIV